MTTAANTQLTNIPDRPVDAAAAGTWQLGDRTVRRLGFGAMRLTGMPWDRHPRDRDVSIAVLRRAVELGINHIDTAAFYFLPTRSANEIISTALYPYTDDLTIVTKVGPSRSRELEFEPYARPDQLRAQVEENIRQLGLDHLQVANLRWGAGLDKEQGSLAEHIGALAELRDQGLIRHIGVSNVDLDQLAEALTITPVVCVQNRYGISDRADDPILDLCADRGIAFVPFFAIGAGVTGAGPGRAEADDAGAREIEAVASETGATPAQIRLTWTLHRAPNVLAIPGTGTPDHLEQNVAAASIRLTDNQLARLNAIG